MPSIFPQLLTLVLCLLISTACYVRSFRSVRLHQEQIQVQQQAKRSLNIAENKRNIMRSKGSAINTINCHIPIFIQMEILAIYPQLWTNAWNFSDTYTLAFMSSSINLFLFCWRFREVRGSRFEWQ